GNRHHKRVLNTGELVEYLFDLDGVDVLATADDHVVFAADDRHVLVLVPCGEVADIQPAVVESGGFLLRRVRVRLRGFRRAHDNLADLRAIPRRVIIGRGEL